MRPLQAANCRIANASASMRYCTRPLRVSRSRGIAFMGSAVSPTDLERIHVCCVAIREQYASATTRVWQIVARLNSRSANLLALREQRVKRLAFVQQIVPAVVAIDGREVLDVHRVIDRLCDVGRSDRKVSRIAAETVT